MKSLIVAVLLWTSAALGAECLLPSAPELPDGDSAELEAMVAAQQAVQAYVAKSDAYLECLARDESGAEDGTEEGEQTAVDGAEMSEEEMETRMEERTAAHNAAVDEMTAVADAFNAEIRKYKARSGN